jgi:hypothetical protein
MIFHLHLLNEKTNSIHKLDIEPINNILGQSWAVLLKEAILSKNCWLVETDRIYHLNDEWSPENTIIKMNECIDVVNSYDNIINYKLDLNPDQEAMNYLHTFFEHLRGKDEDPPEWYINSPRYVKDAVTLFNVLIHRYESFIRKKRVSKITVSYKNRPTREMTFKEKKNFYPIVKAGDVFLKYCHKGKDLLDIFKDQDEHVGNENILPQHKISSDFNIVLDNFIEENTAKDLFSWLEDKKDFLKSIDIDINNPEITIGKGIVGKVITNDIEQLKKELFGITKIHDITYTE